MDSEEISQQHPLTSSGGPEMSPMNPGKTPPSQPEDTSSSNSNFPLLGFSDQGRASSTVMKIKFETGDFSGKSIGITNKKCEGDAKTTNSDAENAPKNPNVDAGNKMKKSILESALSSIPKIMVRVDPETGKKFIIQGGKRYEIVPQSMLPLVSGIKKAVTPAMGNFSSLGVGTLTKIQGGTETTSTNSAGAAAPAAGSAAADTRKTLIIQGLVPSVERSRATISTPMRMPDLAAIPAKSWLPEATTNTGKVASKPDSVVIVQKPPECPPLDWVGKNTKVKIIKQIPKGSAQESTGDKTRLPPYTGLGINYYTHRYSRLNKTTMTENEVEHKGFQIDMRDFVERRDCATQTDSPPDHSLSMINDDFMDYILTDFRPETLVQQRQQQQQQEQVTEAVHAEQPKAAKSKEEIAMWEFFKTLQFSLVVDRSGNMPIHESVMQNDLDSVHKNCIALRARNESVNVYNTNQYTPLHLAILHDASLSILDVLLRNNADMSLTDGEGNTVFHLAVEHCRQQHLNMLLKKVVQLQKNKNTRINLNVFNFEGFTPLIMSCMAKSYNMSKMLLEAGADANMRDLKSGRTALFHAAEAYDAIQVELLIRNKADTRLKNYFGTCPHDAMFDLDDIPPQIKHLILGREHRYQPKKKNRDKDRDSQNSASLQNDEAEENSQTPTPPPPQEAQRTSAAPKRSGANSNNRSSAKSASGSTKTGEKVGKPPPQKKTKFQIKSVLKKLDDADLKNVKNISLS